MILMYYQGKITELWPAIDAHISQMLGQPFNSVTHIPVGGGCINAAYHISGGGRDCLVKINVPERHAMFAAEAAGLQEILASGAIRAPAPICHGSAAHASYLVLEFLAMDACSGHACEQLARQLASMHAHTASQFGWRINNTIGATPQSNTFHDDWISFWREERLEFQFRLASRNGINDSLQKKGACLLTRIEQFFPGYAPSPSLLHGDLWNGNCGVLEQGEPVVFDPAVYYGDRETDLAMSELFGGFPARFYAAYREAYPLDPGYEVRKTLYNLYHVLNHANLFGGSYAGQAERMLDQLLSEVR
ncbi:MAG: fructosamine kinase family protein [Sulfurimicrobium sp.]|nr:fructosamine kinase family protein [Sulfurimicrobium sp.]MDP2199331.1 fructosamine kinase family protein [Sulfurimicrobium sp.]MDP2963745.1 fructosamine kinase family protein [Sulfurimicrobium sp.]